MTFHPLDFPPRRAKRLSTYHRKWTVILKAHLMNADGKGPSESQHINNADDYGGVFSPDGTKLAFISNRDSQPQSGVLC